MTEERCVTPPMISNMMQMMQQQKHAPQTPAQRQAKCRALKRGEQIYAQQLPENWRELPEYAHLRPRLSAQGQPTAALPAPATKALPGAMTGALPAPNAGATTAAASGTAIQKAFSPEAMALALPDADGAGVGGAVSAGDALRLTLPPAVEARLRSLLGRHKSGKNLTAAERAEAQGLLDIAEYFVVQRLRNRLAA